MSIAETPARKSDESQTPPPYKLSLGVNIESTGPCKRHVRVTIPRSDIEHFQNQALDQFAESAAVPGFRVGNVPRDLVKRRFKKELSDEVRQKLLVLSLEQMSENNSLDPINEPDFDLETLSIPETGDFEYEFDVEVRPDFELPDYRGLKIERPVREVTDVEVDDYVRTFCRQYAETTSVELPAAAGDAIIGSFTFLKDGTVLRRLEDLKVEILPTVRFQDGELVGFDQLMIGAKVGDSRAAKLTVSSEAALVELRGQQLEVQIEVKSVEQIRIPELNKELLDRIGFETAEDVKDEVRRMLKRQVEFDQRQSTRKQILGKITDSAAWDLPESLVAKQTENALRREVLEMQQAGFTTQQILGRENQIRQNAITSTRQALKEHFVLDKIATKENIEVSPMEIDAEINMMAVSRGDSPRRVRARLQKSGMIDNLEAQIRERKAVDLLLEHAQFEDVPMPRATSEESRVFSVGYSVCVASTSAKEEQDDDGNA